MKNVKTAWFCSSCGAQAPKWQGRCPACGEWNTMVEEKIVSEKNPKHLLLYHTVREGLVHSLYMK